MSQNESVDFNIYYLNFAKAYEIAMMINNVILTKIEKNRNKSFEEQRGFNSSVSAQGTTSFLKGVGASISTEAKETSFSSSTVMETLEVKTTKSILLRKIIEQCTSISTFDDSSEGDLVKIDQVKLELLDEESLRQFLILRREALKGVRIEGMEINNLISSMLQDYAYILKGTFCNGNVQNELIIKIPLEIQTEFENKYNINDLLVGHVSIIGIYKRKVEEGFVSSNTFTYFGGVNKRQNCNSEPKPKIIKSATRLVDISLESKERDNNEYHFIDTIAIIQDVKFKVKKTEEQNITLKLRWWNTFINWLSKIRRK